MPCSKVYPNQCGALPSPVWPSNAQPCLAHDCLAGCTDRKADIGRLNVLLPTMGSGACTLALFSTGTTKYCYYSVLRDPALPRLQKPRPGTALWQAGIGQGSSPFFSGKYLEKFSFQKAIMPLTHMETLYRSDKRLALFF